MKATINSLRRESEKARQAIIDYCADRPYYDLDEYQSLLAEMRDADVRLQDALIAYSTWLVDEGADPGDTYHTLSAALTR